MGAQCRSFVSLRMKSFLAVYAIGELADHELAVLLDDGRTALAVVAIEDEQCLMQFGRRIGSHGLIVYPDVDLAIHHETAQPLGDVDDVVSGPVPGLHDHYRRVVVVIVAVVIAVATTATASAHVADIQGHVSDAVLAEDVIADTVAFAGVDAEFLYMPACRIAYSHGVVVDANPKIAVLY